MLDTNGKFYLGRIFDTQTRETTDEKLLYDPDDLTTHGVVVGMTGSGKTGLCLDLLEEAGLNDIPALMLDPKGDITNLLLHFPELAADDFEPWINADEARRDGKTVAEAAADTADLWRNGLAGWDIEPDRIQALKDGPKFSVYTPGSDAGKQISILASLQAPSIPWDDNREMLREQISGTVTAILGLAGLKNIDPVRSREHILLANIFEHAWSQGQSLDLGELIMQTQAPPFEKLGVFDINRFFPENDRFDLAMQLNNILASPAFQTWIEGEPLDVERLLYDENGRIRHTIFYIAHLPEAERMFFVTLFYSAVESWMRAQSGTTSLRALVYFDEIFGYLPPVGNPPSKEPMLRMLKQARAFGVGMVLATQNPVDIDYKALSNAGTWFIGKLGTDQDKQRLLDGLSSAMPGGLDRREYDDLISALGKRVFLLRNVHEKQPVLFQTRWAMNYLAGPVTRTKIPELNALAGAGEVAAVPVAAAPSRQAARRTSAKRAAPAPEPEPTGPELPGSVTRPAVPRGIVEYFLPNNMTLTEAASADGRSLDRDAQQLGLLYRPVLVAQANVRFRNRKYGVSMDMVQTAVVDEPDRRGMVRWEDYLTMALEERSLDRAPASQARFETLEAPLSESRTVKSMRTDFIDWIYRGVELKVQANESLKVYAGPETSATAFADMCAEAADAKADLEIEKLQARYQKKIDALKKKLAREERELREDEADLSRRKREELGTHAETVFGFIFGRKRSVSSSMSKRRMTERAKEDVAESEAEIASLQKEIEDLQIEIEDAIDELEEKWAAVAADTTEIPINPYKKDIVTDLFGVAWLPYHLVEENGRLVELAGFGY
ncbi:MAG: hypothetical protein AAF614_17780 [Chloroflexota bacterium]